MTNFYTPGQPSRDDKGLESQPILQENTDALDDVMDVDHYKFSDTTNNRGKHRAIRFKDQTADGDPTTLSDEFAVYAKEDSDSELELFYREPDNGEINQLTKDGNVFTRVTPVAAVNFDNGGSRQSEFNVSSVNKDSTGRYTINFTNPLPDNNYEWSIEAFGTPIALTAGVLPTATYSNSVNTNFLKIEIRDTNLALSNITRCSVLIFRKV